MKALNARQLVKILEQNGFVLTRQRGSHHIYKHQSSGKMVPVPIHKANKPLKIGTRIGIIKQSGIDRVKFN